MLACKITPREEKVLNVLATINFSSTKNKIICCDHYNPHMRVARWYGWPVAA
jgi:hypothetical protein